MAYLQKCKMNLFYWGFCVEKCKTIVTENFFWENEQWK